MTFQIVKSRPSIGIKSVLDDLCGLNVGLLEDRSSVRGLGAVLQLLRQRLAIDLSLLEKKIENRIRQNRLPHCLTPSGSGAVHASTTGPNRVTCQGGAQ